MEGAIRVFAGEFGRATLSIPEESGSPASVLTPGGACCRLMFIAGALTEVEESGDLIRGRIADPTGGFDLVTGGKNIDIISLFRKIPVPSFISVLGNAQLYRRNGNTVLSVRPDHMAVVDRAVRDRWVLATAAATLMRLETVRNALKNPCTDKRISLAITHYHISIRDLDELADMVENAVKSVRPDDIPKTEEMDVSAIVLELLRASKSPRGTSVQDIIDTLTVRGIPQEKILGAIEALIVEDECYQPQKGFVRLL
jgi:RPA family protein